MSMKTGAGGLPNIQACKIVAPSNNPKWLCVVSP